jgi:phage terminase large subunit-like protein
VIDDRKAERVVDFIGKFCCTKSGHPIRLLPWQRDLIRKLYGTLTDDGLRQYRQVFCFLPRRNGKSTFFACLLIHELICGDQAGEIYLVSNTLTQSADAVFDACLSIVQNSPALKKRLKVVKSRGRIINRQTRSRLAVLSSTTSGLMGKDASVLCFDEIAFFRDRRIYANLKGSQLNRRHPPPAQVLPADRWAGS